MTTVDTRPTAAAAPAVEISWRAWTRFGVVAVASLVSFFLLAWVETGDTTYGRGDIGALGDAVGAEPALLTAFSTVGIVVLLAALAANGLAIARRQRPYVIATAALYVVLVLWLILWYERLVDGRDGISPSVGWVLMLIAFGVSAIGSVRAAVGVSPSVARALATTFGAIGSVTRHRTFQPGVVAVVLAVALFLIPSALDAFWVANFTQMALAAVLAASAGMLYGRVGLVSLGQVAPYGIGTWVTMRLAFATSLPYPVLLLIGGLAAALIGVLIGLPALRVSGLYLALVTLMLAAGVELLLGQIKFPNGGTGFNGVVENLGDIKPLRRPSFAESDVAYYRFVVIVAFVLFMVAAFVLSRKPGRAWASVRQSEAAALSGGIDVTRFKLWAFALAAFMAGVAGGLYGGTIPKGMSIDAFNRQAAIFLIAAVIMGGIHSLWGGLLAGFFATCLLKFLTQNVLGHDFWTRFSLSLFGFGLIMNLVQSTKAMEQKGLL